MDRFGGRPWGISCGKTWEKSCKRGVSNGWGAAVARLGSCPSRIHSLYGSYSYIWDFRSVVRKTSNLGLSLGLEREVILRGVRVIFLWSLVKV